LETISLGFDDVSNANTFSFRYAERSGGKKVIRTLKAHSYLVMAGSGILSTLASWPRPDGAPEGKHMASLVAQLTELHSTITRTPLTPEVFIRANECMQVYVNGAGSSLFPLVSFGYIGFPLVYTRFTGY
jgi:hypothetical protein